MKNSNNSSISILGLLGIAFIVLKLTNVINWSWWYVTMPLWGGFVLSLFVVIIWFVFNLVAKSRNNKKISKQITKMTGKKSKFQERLEKMAKERKRLI